MKKHHFWLPGGLLALSLATTAKINGVYAADGDLTQTDDVIVTVESSCSLASSGSSLSPASTYTANIANGEYNTNIAGSTFTITCNDTDGWHLYEVGNTNNTWGTTYMDASTDNPSDDIPTGTTLDGSVSNWAAKFAKGGSDAGNITITTGYTNFSAIPSTPVSIASGTSTAGNSTITATYGVGISSTQSAGSYTGKVLYTLVHPASTNGHTITYDLDGGTGAASSVVVPLGTATTLPTPTKEGYTLQGWYTAKTGGTKVGDGGDTYTPAGNTKLYAHWEEAAVVFDGITRMDQMTTSICSDATVGDSADLIDDRGTSGTQTYTVTKLADGKCWMTQNMRLTYNNTDALAVSNGAGGTVNWTPKTATYPYPDTGTWISSFTDPESYYDNNATNGAYYNWTAAIASNNSGSYDDDGEVANTSICPGGWKLPQNAEGTGSWYTLYQNYNSFSSMTSSPVNIVLGGGYAGNVRNPGQLGFYWTSTASDPGGAYFMTLMDIGTVNTQAYDDRDTGMSVRCVSI